MRENLWNFSEQNGFSTKRWIGKFGTLGKRTQQNFKPRACALNTIGIFKIHNFITFFATRVHRIQMVSSPRHWGSLLPSVILYFAMSRGWLARSSPFAYRNMGLITNGPHLIFPTVTFPLIPSRFSRCSWFLELSQSILTIMHVSRLPPLFSAIAEIPLHFPTSPLSHNCCVLSLTVFYPCRNPPFTSGIKHHTLCSTPIRSDARKQIALAFLS